MNIIDAFLDVNDILDQVPVSRKARGQLFGPEGKFENQHLLNSSTVSSSKLVNFYSLIDSFIVSFSKLLKL